MPKKTNSNIVEIDKDLFQAYIKKHTIIYGYVEPVIFTKLVFYGFGKAQRRVTLAHKGLAKKPCKKTGQGGKR